MQKEDIPPGERSPILKKWRNVYLLVAGVLVAQIILYYFFTQYFE